MVQTEVGPLFLSFVHHTFVTLVVKRCADVLCACVLNSSMIKLLVINMKIFLAVVPFTFQLD